MKLCDIVDAYHPTSGGIRTYIDEKVRAVRSSGEHEHALVIPADRDFHETDGRTQVFGVASPVIPGCSPYRVMLRQGRIISILDRFRPDVIELANPYFQPRAARGFRRRFDAAVVGFYHTDFSRAYVETQLRGRLGRTAGKIAARYARFVHANLDLTLVASPALQRKLSWLGISRVNLVPLGVDTELFHPSRRDPAWRRRLGVNDEDMLLIFAGRIDREKRVDVLIEMMNRLPADLPAKLVILGQGPQRGAAQRAALGNPRVRLLPFEPNRMRLARNLASADIYVSAARSETFGLSVIEAQASGLAVVGQRAGAMVERVSPSTGILVRELDPGVMAEAVAALARNGRRRMGEEARRRVEMNHSWDRTFERVFSLYEEALRRRKGNRGGSFSA